MAKKKCKNNFKRLEIIIGQNEIERYTEYYFKKHPKAKKQPIKAPAHPSLNEILRMSPHGRRNAKNQWEEFIIWLVDDLGLTDAKINKCAIKYTTYFHTRRPHDADNLAPKFILDGFVKSGLLVADDYKHLRPLVIDCAYDEGNPRIEFRIIVLD